MQFPDQSLIGNGNKRPDKIEIDFDDFIVQGLQRNWSRKVKKHKKHKKERRRRAQKGNGESKNPLQTESDGASTNEAGSDE